jgi:ABC-type branched-subunit amino acid transport system ATPase component
MSADRRVSLNAVDVTVRYGGVVANDQVCLRADSGRIVGLIGPNGAGKTSFIDALTGFAQATGTVTIGDVHLDGLAPHERRRAGLARTWQAGELFSSLSALDNVRVAAESAGWGALLKDLGRRDASGRRAAMNALSRVGLDLGAERTTEDLSLGQQKLVGVARALVSEPLVVLLDEPAAGLDSRESHALGRRLREIATDGPALLLVDHDMDLIFEICDTVYVLDFGKIVSTGTPDEVRADKRVLSAYLGASTAKVVKE